MASPQELASQISSQFGDLVSSPSEFRGEIALTISNSGRIVDVCRFAKESCGFDLLLDLSTVDNYGEEPRWTIVYELYSITAGCHLRLKTHVGEEQSEVPSVSTVWPAANWHEREAYDMMGVRFGGHPDLRRILMWEGYPYFPLRKDFPLAGKPTDLPEVAFTRPAPLEGGPFVTSPGGRDSTQREPRARTPQP
ncbi:MAG: NADH-quinone oxidoreductase subunit C [Verrucomicrobiota bacterium]